MPNGFEPQGAFEGYVTAKLEEIASRLNALPCKEADMRLRNCETKLSNIEGKASLFGAIMGFVAGLVSKIFMGR